MSRGFEYYDIKIKNFGVGLSHFSLWTNAVHPYFFNICVICSGKPLKIATLNLHFIKI